MAGIGKSDTVRFDELQRVLRLALELRDLPRGSALQKRHALEGMAALVGAQVGVWARADGMTTGQMILHREIDFGWSCDSERRVFLEYLDSAQWRALDPSQPALARETTSAMCIFTREQLLDDHAWYGSEHVQRFRRSAQVDSFLYGIYAPGGDAAVCFGLHRAWGDRAFSERERRLVEAIHHACAFLHQPATELSPALLQGLSPRLCDTLRGLARGRSEKQLAAELKLSRHTVHDYVKALYRHFGVQSRSELLVRCLGHEPPSPHARGAGAAASSAST